MLRKLLASMMSILMLLTVMMSIPVAAADALPDNLGEDYEPGAVTGNVITYVSGGTDGKLYSGATNYNGFSKRAGELASNFDVTVATTQGTGVYLTANRNIDDPHKYWEDKDGDGTDTWDGETYSYMYPLSGGNIRRNWGSGTGNLGNVVFKFNVKLDDASAGSAIVNFGRYNNAYGAIRAEKGANANLPDVYTSAIRNEYPLEYNSKATGISIDSTEWTEFAGTFISNGLHSVDNYGYTIGFVQGTPYGAKVLFDDDAYMGIEYAYDIDVTAEDTELYSGKSIVVDADVLNQVGVPGGIDQGVTWYAMNEGRTEEVSGFTIVADEDGLATVSVDSTVAAGTYYLVAVAGVNDDFVEGIEVTVAAATVLYPDYVPGEITGNVISSVTGQQNGLLYTNTTYGGNAVGWSDRGDGLGDVYDTTVGVDETSGNMYIVANRDLDDPYKFWADADGDGVYTWDGSTYDYAFPLSGAQSVRRTWADATGTKANVVFKFSVKLAEDSTGPAVVNFGRVNNALASTEAVTGNAHQTTRYKSATRNEYPIEYNSKATGVSVTSTTEWTTLAGTFIDGGTYSCDQYGYILGLAQGNSRGAKVWFDSNAYLGLEYAYDIDASADKQTVAAGETLNVDADVLNQVGVTGGIDQNVTWLAMNENRTAEVSGFSIVEGENGTAVVTVSDTVAAGTYTLVAIADANEDFIQGIEITVEEAEGITELAITEVDGKITVVTPDALEAKLVVATYITTGEGKWRMVDSDVIDVELGAGASQEYTPEVTPGTKTKAMLWTDVDEKCAPLIRHLEY